MLKCYYLQAINRESTGLKCKYHVHGEQIFQNSHAFKYCGSQKTEVYSLWLLH